MDLKVVYFVLGRLALAEAVIMLIPLIMAIFSADSAVVAFTVAAGLSAALGLVMRSQAKKEPERITVREGVAITAGGWALASVLSMLPYVCGGYLKILDALLESISGLTGTGGTVFPTLEVLPASILFWRMLTHYFGGLGIIVIFIALLPQTGQSTVHMYNAEKSSAGGDRVMPRLRDMTKALFTLYLSFTGIAMLVYFACGLSLWDALTHAMSTIGTGGFSNYDSNVIHFDNLPLEMAMTFFMVAAGGNFALYYRARLKGVAVLLKNTEFRAYIGILTGATILITLNLVAAGVEPLNALRYVSFQVGSLSTTGFVSADFETWPAFSKIILLTLMIVGGCAGSTAGGMKVARIVILVQNAWTIARQKFAPRQIVELRVNGSKVTPAEVTRVGQFFVLYMGFIALFTLIFAADGMRLFDALGLSVTTMGNVGPAFGIVGATSTYAVLSDFSKSAVCVSMLLGRLEMFTLLVMLTPDFWQRGDHW